MFKWRSKKNLQESIQRKTYLEEAEKRRVEMEALAARPEVSVNRPQTDPLIYEQVQLERKKLKEQQELQSLINDWIRNNSAKAREIQEKAIKEAFVTTRQLPKDNFPIFRFYCETSYLEETKHSPGLCYGDNTELTKLFHERIKNSGEDNAMFWEVDRIRHVVLRRADEWQNINMNKIKNALTQKINSEILKNIDHDTPNRNHWS